MTAASRTRWCPDCKDWRGTRVLGHRNRLIPDVKTAPRRFIEHYRDGDLCAWSKQPVPKLPLGPKRVARMEAPQ